MKTRKVDGEDVPSVGPDGVIRYSVGLFAKPVRTRNGRLMRGEEIRVTVTSEPGADVVEGASVALVSPTVSPYSFKNDRNETVSGVSFAADAVVVARAARPAESAPSGKTPAPAGA